MQKVIDQIAWMGEQDFDSRALLDHIKSQKGFVEWDVMRVLVCPRYLTFRTRARYFNGWVVVTKGSNDLFVVDCLSTHGNTKFHFENIEYDQIYDTIDTRIVWTPPYTDKLPELGVQVEEQDL